MRFSAYNNFTEVWKGMPWTYQSNYNTQPTILIAYIKFLLNDGLMIFERFFKVL